MTDIESMNRTQSKPCFQPKVCSKSSNPFCGHLVSPRITSDHLRSPQITSYHLIFPDGEIRWDMWNIQLDPGLAVSSGDGCSQDPGRWRKVDPSLRDMVVRPCMFPDTENHWKPLNISENWSLKQAQTSSNRINEFWVAERIWRDMKLQ